MIRQGVELLETELSCRPTDDSPYLLYRLAWGYNQLELPDSALQYALRAWNLQPERELFYCEYLRCLFRLGRYEDIVESGELHRGGGYGRYLIARSERELGLDQRSLRLLSDTLLLDPDDSVSADAALWLSILLEGEVCGDSVLSLARMAVEAAPDPGCFELT